MLIKPYTNDIQSIIIIIILKQQQTVKVKFIILKQIFK